MVCLFFEEKNLLKPPFQVLFAHLKKYQWKKFNRAFIPTRFPKKPDLHSSVNVVPLPRLRGISVKNLKLLPII